MSILIILSAVSVAAATVYGVYVITQIFTRMEKSLHNIDNHVSSLVEEIRPVVENMNAITSKIKTITDDLDDQVSVVRDSVEALRGTVDDVVRFKQRIQNRIEEPMMDTVSFFAAIVKGVKTFIDKMKS